MFCVKKSKGIQPKIILSLSVKLKHQNLESFTPLHNYLNSIRDNR